MDRKVIAFGVLALILAIVVMSGCTSGPATNQTVTPKATMGPTVTLKATVTPAPNVGIVANTSAPAANLTANATASINPGINATKK